MRIKWFSFVRISGLLLVLLYHFFKVRFPGGFIGVDVFFTFSGYLITALLLDEYDRAKAIDLLSFLKRRFYRIVPPLVLMVLVTIPFTFLVKRDFVAGIGGQIAAALGFTTNFYEILTGSSYESQFIPHLFVHTWSLAIEVHFYVLWGILLWLLAKRQLTAKNFRALIFLVSAGLFAISFISMFARAFMVSNFSLIYFSSLSHSFPFFLGALLATMTGIKDTTARYKKNVNLWKTSHVLTAVVGSFLLLLVLSLFLDFNHLLTYLFGFVLASIFASVMIYGTRVLSDKTPKLKEPALVTYLADISYGLYLFHWPFYIIFTQLLPNGPAVFLTLLFSIIFATLSFYILEPYLAGKPSVFLGLTLPVGNYQKALLGLGGILTVISLGVVVTAPKMGEFESNLLVSSLQQAQSNLNRTHTLVAGDANALSNVMIIGDSVALRSSTSFTELLPEAQLDASVSRNFDQAYEIFQNHIKNNTLPNTVVIAVGVNSVGGYDTATQAFIDALPDGHRLIFVTPYNAKDGRIKEMVAYERSLSETYKYVSIADWYQTALDNPQIWSGSDGVHYSDSSTEGASLYVQTIQSAITAAAKKPAKEE